MNKLFALAVTASGIIASVDVAQAGTPPVQLPEPSSIALVGIGAAVLAWWQLGRRK
jgi:PEP-CTERM motif-containing protein